MPTPKARLPGGHGSLGGVGDVTTSEIMRILRNVLRVGKVKKSDAEKGTYDIDYGDNKVLGVHGRVSRAGEDQTDDMHDDDEQVIVFSPDGALEKGIVLGAVYKDGKKPFKDKNHSGRKYKDGTVVKHDREKKERTVVMKDGGTHANSVGKNKQTIDDKGTRLENDKATVHVKSDGTIQKVNQGGGVVIAAGGSVYINC